MTSSFDRCPRGILLVASGVVLALAGCVAPPPDMSPDTSLPPETVYEEQDLAAYHDDVTHVRAEDILRDKDGQQQWKVALAFQNRTWAVVYARRDGGSWSALRIIPSPLPQVISGPAATLDAAGRPVIVWQGQPRDNYLDFTLFCARWTGRGFAVRPLVSNRSYSQASVCTDSRGAVHLVYCDKLSPEECYMIGLDGECPRKYFHRICTDGQWSLAHPTSPRGRYDVHDGRLTPGPDGAVWLTAVIRPLGHFVRGDRYTATQKWDGLRWSDWRRGASFVTSPVSQ